MAVLNIGQKIRELRKSKKISQEELGLEIGVSRQTVNKWEADIVMPSADNIKVLCEYFNVRADYFISDEAEINGEIALTTDKQKEKTIKIALIIALVLLSIAFIVSLGFTVGIGFIVFSDARTGIDYVSTSGVETPTFFIWLAVAIVFLVGIIFLSVALKRKSK